MRPILRGETYPTHYNQDNVVKKEITLISLRIICLNRYLMRILLTNLVRNLYTVDKKKSISKNAENKYYNTIFLLLANQRVMQIN